MVNGEIVGATVRIPAESQWLANLSQGGTATHTDVAPEEREMAKAISPVLEEKGVALFGFDRLVGLHGRRVFSEINTLNVGGFLQAEEHSGQPVIAKTAELLIKYCDEYL